MEEYEMRAGTDNMAWEDDYSGWAGCAGTLALDAPICFACPTNE